MISFVYFDVGGVVIRDFSGTDKWDNFKKLIDVKKEQQKEFDFTFRLYEKNELCLNLKVDSLIPILTKQFDINFPPNFSIQNYFIDHFESNNYIVPIINEVMKHCKVGLLTNMYVNMFEDIKKHGLLPNVNWDAIVDSSKVLLQKPDLKIYELAEKMCKHKGEEILFIDNTQLNLDTANKLGWYTFLYDSKKPKESANKLSDYWQQLIN